MIETVHILFSFPHRIGAGRICDTAWEQVNGVADAGVEVTALVGSVARPLDDAVETAETLVYGPIKLPYRVVGHQRMFALHDRLVARFVRRHRSEIDLIHSWPSGSLETLRTAREFGIPVVLERPSAHTRYVYEAVRAECGRLGVELPADHEYAYRHDVLEREEAEFGLATALLCPSEFTAQTFRDAGFPEEKLIRHVYGVDPETFYPAEGREDRPFTAIFVGLAAVLKGLHFALEAWRRSTASREGRFLIAGEILPDYRRVLEPLIDSSVVELGHRTDVPELMRQADVLLFPSIVEGFGLVCTEAMASGCVPLVSSACTELCVQGKTALVHGVGDVKALSAQLSLISEDRTTLEFLRRGALAAVPDITWAKAGERLADIYEAIAA